MPESSRSRIGSIMAYGIVTCSSPPPPSSSILNEVTTTTSDGLTILAKCGLISEFRYSMLMRAADAPGLGQVGKRLAQHHLHDASFGLGEFAALDLGVAAVAAEEVIDDGEHQRGIERQQRGAAQRIDLDQVQARRHVQVLGVLDEFLHLDRRDARFPACAGSC